MTRDEAFNYICEVTGDADLAASLTNPLRASRLSPEEWDAVKEYIDGLRSSLKVQETRDLIARKLRRCV